MAGGDVTEIKPVQSSSPGGPVYPKLVVCAIEFGSGATGITNVTAQQLGLRLILGFSAGVYGASTNVGEFVYSTDAYVATGRTEMDLECINDASTLVDRTVTVLFWGIT